MTRDGADRGERGTHSGGVGGGGEQYPSAPASQVCPHCGATYYTDGPHGKNECDQVKEWRRR